MNEMEHVFSCVLFWHSFLTRTSKSALNYTEERKKIILLAFHILFVNVFFIMGMWLLYESHSQLSWQKFNISLKMNMFTIPRPLIFFFLKVNQSIIFTKQCGDYSIVHMFPMNSCPFLNSINETTMQSIALNTHYTSPLSMPVSQWNTVMSQ